MVLVEIFKSLRPYQWTKNLFVFAPLIFSQNVFHVPYLFKTILAFAIFCILSGAVYIWNDLRDIEEDKLHPLKSQRPLASGRLGKTPAAAAFVVFSLVALGCASLLNEAFFILALAYFLLQILYSVWLKHVVILDVLLIAAGFLLRVSAGGVVILVDISDWLLICTFLLALFIALSKRRHELVLLEKNAGNHRPILQEYSPYLLDQMISVVTASTVVAYCLYTISEETVAKFGSSRLIYTVPFVLYGIFRYLYLIHKKGEGGSPESLILKDKPFLAGILLWIISAIIILYVRI
ncbi:MAG: decaprenyl-phosphate phosphoribosyltransferase [Candidatus Aminicenantes bacterium]|nr:decaprenyl-phosphate phosphoribosyltransferase [Candidatus Aminicenantes bacterium]